jgi:hypothetical protein
MVLLRDPAGELVLFTRPFTSGPDGLVEIQGVRASGYRATVSHASYSPASIDVQAGGADEPVVTLRPGGRVQVKVLERRGGRPAEGSEVELLDERGQNVAEDRFFLGPGSGQGSVTDASGSLLLDQVAPGAYRLAAKRGKSRSREEKVSVGEGQVAEKVLTLD